MRIIIVANTSTNISFGRLITKALGVQKIMKIFFPKRKLLDREVILAATNVRQPKQGLICVTSPQLDIK